jgi:hypothetical protein
MEYFDLRKVWTLEPHLTHSLTVKSVVTQLTLIGLFYEENQGSNHHSPTIKLKKKKNHSLKIITMFNKIHYKQNHEPT